MSVKSFDSKFGLTSTTENEKRKFVNRLNIGVFEYFEREFGASYEYHFRQVCFELGENPDEIIRKHSSGMVRPRPIPSLQVLAGGDFLNTLRTVVAAYHSLGETGYYRRQISNNIKDALERSNINIGIEWADGVFYPTGEVLLDKVLVEESLEVLKEFPNENRDLKIALDNYQAKRLDGVIENCYLAVEGLGRILLKNGKTLENNKVELLRNLSSSRHWSGIFGNYLSYANEYRRHAGENRHDLKPVEVEAFLYLTCLIIRAIVRSDCR